MQELNLDLRLDGDEEEGMPTTNDNDMNDEGGSEDEDMGGEGADNV